MAKILVKDGVEEAFPDAMVEEKLAAGWSRRDDEVLETTSGRRLIEANDVAHEKRAGGTEVSADELAAERAEMREERAFGDEGVQAFGEAALTQVPILGDAIVEGISRGVGEDAGAVAARARQNTGASLAGSVVGQVGGLGTLGLAGKAGKLAAGAVKGGKAVKGAVAGVTEGTLFGGSQAVANTLLHDREITAESVVGGMGTGALFGGLFGAGAGALAGRAAKNATKTAAKSDDATALGETAFKQIDDLKRTREALKLEAKGIPDAITRKAWKAEIDAVNQAEKAVTKILGPKPSQYAERVAKLEPAQLKAFVRDLKQYDSATKLMASATGRELPPVQLFGAADDLAVKAGLNSGKTSDIVAIAKAAGIKNADEFAAEVAGSPLAENAVKAWAATKKMGLGKSRTGADFFKAGAESAMKWSNPAAAMGAVLSRATGAISTAKNTVGNGLVKALTNKAGGRAGYTPAASTVLNRISFDAGLGETPRNTGKAQATYQKRVAEILAASDNPGAFQAKIRERVAPLAHMSPEAGEAIVAQTQKVADYLASKIVRPALAFGFGSDDGLPISQATIDNFAAYAQGATDPLSLIDDIGNDALDPRAAEAMRELYPSIFAEAQVRIATMTPAEKADVPWNRQVQLSIFFGVPMHEILRPEAVGAIQEGYAQRALEAEQPAKDFTTPGKVGNGVGITEPPTAAQKLEMK